MVSHLICNLKSSYPFPSLHDSVTSPVDWVSFSVLPLLIFVPSFKINISKWKQTKYGSLQEPQKD